MFLFFRFPPQKCNIKYCVLSNQKQNGSFLPPAAVPLLAETLKDYAYQTGDVVLSYRRRGAVAQSPDI